ncbi:MAG: TraB/GumN family protein [Pseudomonadota bacterium]
MASSIRALAALLAAALLAAARPAAAEPAIWVVRDADSTIVLFGSVHVLPSGVDWRPAALDAALAAADDIWFEAPMGPEGRRRAAEAAGARGYLPAGVGLSALLSADGRARLQRVCELLRLAPSEVERLAPWYADLTLGLAALARQGAVVDTGVEQVLAAAAPAARQRAFETPEAAIEALARVPLAEQVAGLEDSLRQLEDDPGFYTRLIEAWRDGEVKAIEDLGLAPMRAVSLTAYRALIVERNARWTAALLERLEGSGETVVVVGAGHLVGPDSIPAMLRARGVTVEGP